jgi:hypothetical protein
MIKILPTNQTFETRLDAKIAIGSGKFNRLFKDGQIIFIDNNLSCANYDTISSTTSRTIKN